jgi:integrase
LFYVGACVRYFGSEVATSSTIMACLAGLRREHQARCAPFNLADLRPSIITIGKNRDDIRDRLMILLAAFGAMTGCQIVRLRKDHVRFVDGGMELDVDGKTRFIGAAEDPELDPVVWMRRWLEGAQARTGPLFPRMYRGSEQEEPADKSVPGKAVRRWLPHAIISERGGLRFSFLAASVRKNGAVATLHFLQLRRFRDAVYYAPEMRLLQSHSSI